MNIQEYISKQLKDREELLHIVRRHPVVLVPPVGFGVLLILADFFLLAWWFQHHWWGVVGFLLVIGLAAWTILRAVYLWLHNALGITTQRVIDVDQQGVFERHVAEAPFEKIQDIRYTIKGLWPTLFHFGTIVVQTAGATTNLELSGVARPVELQQELSDLQRRVPSAGQPELTAAELVSVVERLKKQLGPAGLERLLHEDQSHSDGQIRR